MNSNGWDEQWDPRKMYVIVMKGIVLMRSINVQIHFYLNTTVSKVCWVIFALETWHDTSRLVTCKTRFFNTPGLWRSIMYFMVQIQLCNMICTSNHGDVHRQILWLNSDICINKESSLQCMSGAERATADSWHMEWSAMWILHPVDEVNSRRYQKALSKGLIIRALTNSIPGIVALRFWERSAEIGILKQILINFRMLKVWLKWSIVN